MSRTPCETCPHETWIAGAGERDLNLLWDVFVYDRSSGVTIRASADDSDEWREPNRAPSLDGSGRVLTFSSRHPSEADEGNDDDLFVWMRAPLSSTVTRQDRH